MAALLLIPCLLSRDVIPSGGALFKGVEGREKALSAESVFESEALTLALAVSLFAGSVFPQRFMAVYPMFPKAGVFLPSKRKNRRGGDGDSKAPAAPEDYQRLPQNADLPKESGEDAVVRAFDLTTPDFKRSIGIGEERKDLVAAELENLSAQERKVLNGLFQVREGNDYSQPGRYFLFGDNRGIWMLAHARVESGSQALADNRHGELQPLIEFIGATLVANFEQRISYVPIVGWPPSQEEQQDFDTADQGDPYAVLKKSDRLLLRMLERRYEPLEDLVQAFFPGSQSTSIHYLIPHDFVNVQLEFEGADHVRIIVRPARLSNGTEATPGHWTLDDADPSLIRLNINPQITARRNRLGDFDLLPSEQLYQEVSRLAAKSGGGEYEVELYRLLPRIFGRLGKWAVDLAWGGNARVAQGLMEGGIRSVIGVDNFEIVAHHNPPQGLLPLRATAFHLPLTDHSIAFFILNESLEHIFYKEYRQPSSHLNLTGEDLIADRKILYSAVFEEAYRVLQPGGVLGVKLNAFETGIREMAAPLILSCLGPLGFNGIETILHDQIPVMLFARKPLSAPGRLLRAA